MQPLAWLQLWQERVFVQWISRLTNSWKLAVACSGVADATVLCYTIEERERERKRLDEEENVDCLVLLPERSV